MGTKRPVVVHLGDFKLRGIWLRHCALNEVEHEKRGPDCPRKGRDD